MVWCAQCAADVEVEADDQNGFACCVQCGRVVEDTAFSSDVMFTKGGDGEGEMVGQMVGASGEARGLGRYSGGRMWGSGGDSHEAAVSRGRHEIVSLVEALRISPSGEAVEAAHRLYRLALQRNFTRGRRVNQVAAVCLYIFCRLERRPYMLIDFSDHLSVNVYALGAVFLQLLKLLRLDEHATLTKPIDPSLFLNRFVDRLRLPTQELKSKVGNTAMRLVQSMKRDWMLTGRRPSGICGAALFLAAHIHGVEKTKKDVIAIVHIGWATVERRVMELAETRDAELTLKELGEREKAVDEQREQMLLEYERQAVENPQPRPAALTAPPEGAEGGDGGADGEGGSGQQVVAVDPNEVGRYCEHVRAGAPLLAHGMCRGCLEDYLKITLATQGTNDPPCYIANLRRDVKRRVREQLAVEKSGLLIKGAGEVLALPGPSGLGAGASGSGGGDDIMDDLHRRRHMENEEALEAGASGGGGGGGGDQAQHEQQQQQQDKEGAVVAAATAATTAAGGRKRRGKAAAATAAAAAAAAQEAAGGAAGPSTSQAGGAAGEGAAGGTGAYGSAEDGAGPGPSSSAAAAAAGGGGSGRRAGSLRAEEDDFDAALHSSELQPLAKALGGEAAAVASAPLRRPRSPEPEPEPERRAGGAAGAGAAAGAEEEAEEEARAKRQRLAVSSEAGAAGAAAAAAADTEAGGTGAAVPSEIAAAADAERRAAAAAAAAAAARAEEEPEDEGEELSDHLSDVDDDEIGCYLATSEEATIRESLWTEMNKDWIEKQEVKRKEAEEAAKDPSKAGSDKAKRKYNRKPKAEMPAAEDAAAAARNLLEAKKLSNKINYGALEDLFGGGTGADADAGGGGGAAAGRRSTSPDAPPVAPPVGGYGGGTGRSAAAAAAAAAFADDLEPRPAVAAALAKRAADRARAQAADADKYAAALEDEQRKRVGGGGVGGGGGGLGGGFLDSLTFARGGGGGGGAEGGRTRPAGLSLRPRGRLGAALQGTTSCSNRSCTGASSVRVRVLVVMVGPSPSSLPSRITALWLVVADKEAQAGAAQHPASTVLHMVLQLRRFGGVFGRAGDSALDLLGPSTLRLALQAALPGTTLSTAEARERQHVVEALEALVVPRPGPCA
ncbi:hypothetical protein HYH02_011208 [Chlamydomonas schloesseri]|uniref:Cyclin-like domain-containing protein n=1 Tax=Chlamydomonas schloesseri TaxID=2026947 RepID=A0A835T545_9CHLO|nr:hypothetical protein HYH02_011208 [Chlamydomonas schloesseri]|eukprot:KAG2437566.1 hypothetical protein HYH02_011208 [Chlamydomonas schloesseri]